LFLDEFSIGVLGTVAGILILSGWVPQIAKGYKTKKLDDVSSYLMILIACGAFLWLIYGLEKEDPFIMGVNIAAIALTLVVLSMKFRYAKKIV